MNRSRAQWTHASGRGEGRDPATELRLRVRWILATRRVQPPVAESVDPFPGRPPELTELLGVRPAQALAARDSAGSRKKLSLSTGVAGSTARSVVVAPPLCSGVTAAAVLLGAGAKRRIHSRAGSST